MKRVAARTARPRGVRLHRVRGGAGPGLADRQAGSSGRGPRMDGPSRGPTSVVRRDGSRERRRAGPCPRARDRQARLVSRAARLPERRGCGGSRAQAGGATSRLGSVRVRRPPARPLVFAQPTSIDLEPAGTLLLVENNPGRVLRVNPANGRVSVLVPGDRPAVRGRPRSVGQRLRLGREPAAAPERQRAADDRGRGARRSRDRADRGRARTATSTTRPRRRSSGSREARGRRSGSPAPGKQVEAVTAVRP